MQEELERLIRGIGRRGRRAVVAGVIRGEQHLCGCRFPRGQPVDQHSLFEIGSITKAFTGVLLADMVLAGELALDDPLSRHLPDGGPVWRCREPTLLELATHRSGLPNTPGPMARRELAHAAGLRSRDPWADLTAAEYRQLVARESPRRAPGSRFRYSSMAVGLLGDALAARAGATYEEVLAARVLRPLGMGATAVDVSPARREQLMSGHSGRGKPRPPIEDFMPAAGSLRSNAEDMLRFLAACLDPPSEGPGPALALAQKPHPRIGRGAAVGLCWMISAPRNGSRVVWHNGGTWGFRSYAGFSPDGGRAAVVLSNTNRTVDRLGFELVRGI